MPEAVIVSTARSPIGRANKGSMVDVRPDDLAAAMVTAALDKVPAARPPDRRGRDDRLRAAGRRAGLQPRPRRGAPRRHGRRARHDRQPLLLVVAADDPHGCARDQVRRGRRVRRRGRRVREPVRQGSLGRQPRHHQRPLRRRARPHEGAPGGGGTHVDAGRGPARHLHRDGPDRGERGAGRGRDPRGDGRVRGAVAAARGGVAAQRLLRAGDHPDHPAGRHPRSRRTTGRATAPPPRSSRSSSRCSVPTAR